MGCSKRADSKGSTTQHKCAEVVEEIPGVIKESHSHWSSANSNTCDDYSDFAIGIFNIEMGLPPKFLIDFFVTFDN